MRKKLLMLVCCLTIGGYTMAQRQVSGKVLAKEDKTPLPGVTIVVKGSAQGTVTNAEGQYTIEVPSDSSILVFSFVGLKDVELLVGSQSEIDVEMETESEVLSEVVVTALGLETEKKRLGVTSASFNNTDLTQGRNANLLQSLQGKVAGANITVGSGAPGASTRIVLRGDARIGNSEPLIVIDGVPMNNTSYGSNSLNGGTDLGNGINAVNPEDIEDITIMQGGAGTALYGSRGAQGVIFITTKKGRKDQKPTVSFTAGVNFENILKLPNYQNQFGQGFFGEEVLDENTSWGPEFNGQMRLWGRKVNNQQQLKPYKALPNNVKDFFETGIIQTYTAAVSGGTQNSSYYLSYGVANHDGIMPTGFDRYNRHTFSARTETKLSDRITSSFSINYAKTTQGYSPTGQGASVYNQILQTPRDISLLDLKDIDNPFNDLNGFYNSYAINPWLVLKKFGNDARTERFYGNAFLKYKISDWLSFNTRMGTDLQTLRSKNWAPILAPVTPNSANTNPGSVRESVFTERLLNADVFLSANRKLNEVVGLNVMAGINIQHRENTELSSSVATLLIPEFYHISNSTERPTTEQAIFRRRNGAGYLTAELSYKNFLFLTAAGRVDISSTLPAGKNVYPFYGLSAGFVFTDLLETNEKILSYGKLRLAHSLTGNDAPVYRIKPVFVSADHSDGFTSLTYPLPNGVQSYEVGNTIGNPSLKPEFVVTNEAGFDLRFLKNAVGLDFTLYNRTTTDLILTRQIPASSGYTNQTVNAGSVENKGFEMLIRITPIKRRGFRWDASLNYSANRNKLLSLPDGQTELQIGGLSSIGYFAIPGEPLGVFRGNAPQYTKDGKIIVGAADGYPVIAPNKSILGNSQNRYIAGLTNTFSYKGLSLSFTVDTRRGGLIYSRNVDLHYFSGTAIATTYNNRMPFVIPNSVVDNGDGTYSPNTTPIGHHVGGDLQTFWDRGGFNLDKTFMLQRDFLKLREVSLTYMLPKKILSKTPFRDASIQFTGRNLLIWVPISNQFQDPEATTFGTGIESAFGDFGATPTTRNWGFNLRFSF